MEFLGGPVVRVWGSIPALGTKIPQASRCGQNKSGLRGTQMCLTDAIRAPGLLSAGVRQPPAPARSDAPPAPRCLPGGRGGLGLRQAFLSPLLPGPFLRCLRAENKLSASRSDAPVFCLISPGASSWSWATCL